MKKQNIKTVNVFISCEQHLQLIKNTQALKTFFYDPNSLKVGDNIIKVNHCNFSKLLETQLYGKAIVTEII